MRTASPGVPKDVSSGVFETEEEFHEKLQDPEIIKLLTDGADPRVPGFSNYTCQDKLDPRPGQILTWYDKSTYPFCSPSNTGDCRQYQWHALCMACKHLRIESGRMVQCDHFAKDTKRNDDDKAQKWFNDNDHSLVCKKAKELLRQGNNDTTAYHNNPIKLVDRVVPKCYHCGDPSETSSTSTVKDDGLTKPIAPHDKHKKVYFPRANFQAQGIQVQSATPTAVGAVTTTVYTEGTDRSRGAQTAVRADLRRTYDADTARRSQPTSGGAGRTQASLSTSTHYEDDDDDEADVESLAYAERGS